MTILSLAIDPFTQQILSYPSRLVAPSNETARVQRTRMSFPDWVDQPAQNTYLSNARFSNDLDPPMQIAILSGLFPSTAELRSECSTGDCTYQKFTSLGFCSQRTEVTKQVCKPDENKMLMADDVFTKSPLQCTYTTPSNIKITSEWTCYPGSDDKNINVTKDP